jgi:hypothetical protein
LPKANGKKEQKKWKWKIFLKEITKMITRNNLDVFKLNKAFLNNFETRACAGSSGPETSATESSGPERHCLHFGDNCPVHQMIIRHIPGAWVAPHFHAQKTESFVILKGRMRIYIFSKTSPGPLIEEVFDLWDQALLSGPDSYDAANSGSALPDNLDSAAAFLAKGTIHSMEAIDKPAVFLETTAGPFIKKEHLCFPAWYKETMNKELQQIMDSAAKKAGLKKIDRF